MGVEKDMAAKIYGEILAEGMSLAECDLEGIIESNALVKLKEIEKVICSTEEDVSKVKRVEMILKER